MASLPSVAGSSSASAAPMSQAVCWHRCCRGAAWRGPLGSRPRPRCRRARVSSPARRSPRRGSPRGRRTSFVFQSPGLLPGAGGGPVAVQHLGLVLVPGGGGAVGVDDQGPAPAVDDDLVVEGAEQHAVLYGGGAAVGLVLGVVHLAG